MNIIDFHNHHLPRRFASAIAQAAPANQRERWQALSQRLTDEDLLLREIREGDLSARIVNMAPALIAGADGRVAHDTIRALNDELAELVARHPGRLHGLASVDAYDGERSAREVERCVRELRLRGVFVDCARCELLLDAPQARPTLGMAAKLGVPLLVHPVAPQPLTRQMAPCGVVGALFARGTANSAALVALVEGGVLAELPGLRVVVTALALGGVAMAAGLSRQSLRQVFIDTNICDARVIRAAVELLGADNVIAGSDWPINEGPFHRLLPEVMERAGLSRAQQDAIAGGNCRRLLAI